MSDFPVIAFSLTTRPDAVVIGGGILGLLLARELVLAGRQVLLLEAGQCGQESSWAGGGIVSPLYPWRYPPAVTALARQAQAAFPALCTALAEATGIDPEWQCTGLLMLDAPDAAEAQAWAQAQGVAMEGVPADRLLACEPQLAPDFQAGLWMPQVANVRNPRLLQALKAMLLQSRACEIREFSPVQQLVQAGQSVRVYTANAVVEAPQVVVCAGAWTAALLGHSNVGVPVEPVRGQMLLYRLPPGVLRTMVLHDGRYAIPRRDGHVLVGSTLEYVGFDKNTTRDAAQVLQAAAERLLPVLRGVSPIRQWAGLRPGSPGGIPVMGAVPGWSGLFACAGHFRNGLVLAPASAQFMADILLGRTPSVDLSPYALR